MNTLYRRCFFISKICVDIIVGAFIYKATGCILSYVPVGDGACFGREACADPKELSLVGVVLTGISFLLNLLQGLVRLVGVVLTGISFLLNLLQGLVRRAVQFELEDIDIILPFLLPVSGNQRPAR